MITITEPGVYDIPPDVYHADPVPAGSLSCSGAKLLLPPSCPAKFRHQQLHGQEHRQVFDFGTAAHTMILGNGPALTIIEADSWRTTDARDEAATARAAGATPLLRKEHDELKALTAAVHADPVAAALLETGTAEQSLFWIDELTGTWLRGRLDWNRPGLIVDFKTTTSCDTDSLERAIHTYGYHQQAAMYVDGAKAAMHLDEDPAFVFLFAEKTPPYLVRAVELTAVALRIGRDRNREAIDLYTHCKATDTWPGYSSDIDTVSVPAYIENTYLKDYA